MALLAAGIRLGAYEIVALIGTTIGRGLSLRDARLVATPCCGEAAPGDFAGDCAAALWNDEQALLVNSQRN